MDRARGPWIGQLGLRLSLAFVGVALAAVTVAIGLVSLTVTVAVNNLVRTQHRELAQAVAVAAGTAYNRTQGWNPRDLKPVTRLGATAGASVRVRDGNGTLIRQSKEFEQLGHARQLTKPIFVAGKVVGHVTVRFTDKGLGAAIQSFEANRWGSRLRSASAAVLIALLVGLVISRRITKPVDALIRAARARGSGGQTMRASDLKGFGEIRELASAFDQMADSLDHEEQARRNLAADVTHELRTPIAVLQAGHEAMLDGVTEPTAENLASLLDEVLRLARMVHDLQRLSSAEAAAMQLTVAAHDLAAIVATAADSLAGSFDSAGITLTTNLTWVPVMCDPLRMHEIVTNLLTNAVKFTPAGGQVLVEAGPDPESAGTLAGLRVSDTGMGIPPDEMSRVSERFFRGQRSAGIAGSGIGMTIVAELVRAHHGMLVIESVPDEGTQVTITLPLASTVPSADQPRYRAAPERALRTPT
jgi:two-component system, OmpR family, sensor histidine kinase BaeS